MSSSTYATPPAATEVSQSTRVAIVVASLAILGQPHTDEPQGVARLLEIINPLFSRPPWKCRLENVINIDGDNDDVAWSRTDDPVWPLRGRRDRGPGRGSELFALRGACRQQLLHDKAIDNPAASITSPKFSASTAIVLGPVEGARPTRTQEQVPPVGR